MRHDALKNSPPPDSPNHLLAHPVPWHKPEAVEAILYLSDLADCAGGTAVVARKGNDDLAYPWPIADAPGRDMTP